MGEVDATEGGELEGEVAAEIVTGVPVLWVGGWAVGGLESFLVAASPLLTSFTFTFLALELSPTPLGTSFLLEVLVLVEGH